MPQRYDYTERAYRHYCANAPACASSVLLTENPQGRDVRGDIDRISGREVSTIFRTRASRGGLHSHCRQCQSQAAPRVRGPRVPGTARIVSADQRRFGVELELIFPRGVTRERVTAALADAGLTGWRAKYDGSLTGGNGLEVVSPILTGENGEAQIRTATRVLRGLGATPNRSCGMHVHHEARDLTADGFKALARGWKVNQPLIDGLVSPSRRNGANHYCQPLTDGDVQRIESCSTVEQITREGQRISRYKTLNFAALGRYHTVEVRQHQGTCDPEKIISWVKFGQGIVAAAATTDTSAATQQTHGRVRDLLGAFGSHLNETARTFLLGRAVEFGSVEV